MAKPPLVLKMGGRLLQPKLHFLKLEYSLPASYRCGSSTWLAVGNEA